MLLQIFSLSTGFVMGGMVAFILFTDLRKEIYSRAKRDGIQQALRIIDGMKESAEANMMFKEAETCELIMKAIAREVQ